jgi:hypothetical protein
MGLADLMAAKPGLTLQTQDVVSGAQDYACVMVRVKNEIWR